VDQPNEKSGEVGLPCSSTDGNSGVAAADSIDQIRDIIFGSQMKEYERRFRRLEEHNRQCIADLHAEVCQRLDAIEAFARKEFEAHGESLKSEESRRAEAFQVLADQLGDAVRALSGSIAAQAEKQAGEAQDLRQALTDLSQSLSEEIRRKHVESSQRLDQGIRELEEAKVARTALSEMLLDLAARLSGQPASSHDSGAAPRPHD
jgi:hypothetical protein